MTTTAMTVEPGVVEQPVKTVSPYKREGAGVLHVRRWAPEERSKRAIKRLAVCWLLAFFVVLIPPHIPWFVIAFLTGPILAWLATRQGGTVRTSELPCPDCQTTVEVEEQPERWPLAARCKGCGNIFSIEQAPAAAQVSAKG